MKRKVMAALLMAAIMALGTVSVFAVDYAVPEDALTVTARFFLVEPVESDNEFAMVSEDGDLVINITDNTIIYFEDYVPVDDDSDELTQMVREVLFGRTLAEVLDGRNMRVIYEESEEIEPISIMVLFEVAVTLPQPIDLETDDAYTEIVPLPGVAAFEDPYPVDEDDASEEVVDVVVLNGEIVVNNEIIANAPRPFWQDNVVMVPLRGAAEALGYDVRWNDDTRSIQLGVAVHIWIGNTEAHLGRMAPLELTAAPIIVDDRTFVPLDFFSTVLGQTVYVFEGQVVIETDSDMS